MKRIKAFQNCHNEGNFIVDIFESTFFFPRLMKAKQSLSKQLSKIITINELFLLRLTAAEMVDVDSTISRCDSIKSGAELKCGERC